MGVLGFGKEGPLADRSTIHTLWLVTAQIVYCFFLGYWTMIIRNRNVSGKVLKEHFAEEHRKYNMKPAKLGYPDMGTGRFSTALPYDNWFKWNCGMRAHQNALENLVISVIATLGNWYFSPFCGVLFGLAIFVTRVIYTMVYMVDPRRVELASRANTACIAGGLLWALVQSF